MVELAGQGEAKAGASGRRSGQSSLSRSALLSADVPSSRGCRYGFQSRKVDRWTPGCALIYKDTEHT